MEKEEEEKTSKVKDDSVIYSHPNSKYVIRMWQVVDNGAGEKFGEKFGELVCGICYELMKDPVMNNSMDTGSPCQTTYCRECISQWLKEHGSCPCCRRKTDVDKDLIIDTKTIRSISSLRVHCPNGNDKADDKCRTIVSLGSDFKTYHEHVDTCPCQIESCMDCEKLFARCKILIHQSTCPEKMVECLIIKIDDGSKVLEGCGVTMVRRDLEKHQEECRHRVVTCAYPAASEDCTIDFTPLTIQGHNEAFELQHLRYQRRLDVAKIGESSKYVEEKKKEIDELKKERRIWCENFVEMKNKLDRATADIVQLSSTLTRKRDRCLCHVQFKISMLGNAWRESTEFSYLGFKCKLSIRKSKLVLVRLHLMEPRRIKLDYQLILSTSEKSTKYEEVYTFKGEQTNSIQFPLESLDGWTAEHGLTIDFIVNDIADFTNYPVQTALLWDEQVEVNGQKIKRRKPNPFLLVPAAASSASSA